VLLDYLYFLVVGAAVYNWKFGLYWTAGAILQKEILSTNLRQDKVNCFVFKQIAQGSSKLFYVQANCTGFK
jgi:hypothetical protein